MRAAFHFVRARGGRRGALYLTEQATPLFRAFAAGLGRDLGGRYFPLGGTPPGQVNAAGVRHEDLTALTFPDRSFGCVASLEVLEHVPAHRPALEGLFRRLASGGTCC